MREAHTNWISPWILTNRFGISSLFLRCARRVGLSCTFPSHGGNATGESDTRAGARHCTKTSVRRRFNSRQRNEEIKNKKEEKQWVGRDPNPRPPRIYCNQTTDRWASWWWAKQLDSDPFHWAAAVLDFSSALCSDCQVQFLSVLRLDRNCFCDVSKFCGWPIDEKQKKARALIAARKLRCLPGTTTFFTSPRDVLLRDCTPRRRRVANACRLEKHAAQ